MKRMYFGMALLAVLLALSLFCGMYLLTQSQQVCATLEQAEECSFAGDFAGASAAVESAYSCWRQHQNRFATLVDHAPMEQIDALFRQAGVYARMGQGEEFTVLCGEIGCLVLQVSQAQQLYWWNVL